MNDPLHPTRRRRRIAGPVVGTLLFALASTSIAWGECLEFVGSYDRGEARSLDVASGYAYVGAGESILVLDLADLTEPQLVGEVTMPRGRAPLDLAVVDDVLYLTNGLLQIFDVSDPTTPTLISTLPTTVNPTDVVVANGHLFLFAVPDSGIHIYRLDGPGQLTGVTFVPFGNPRRGTVEGSFGYFLSAAGLRIFDVANPSAPNPLGDVALPWPNDVRVDGDFAFVVDQDDGLVVIDVSRPAQPQRITHLPLDFTPNTLEVIDDHAYVANTAGDLVVIDISNPASPTTVTILEADPNGNGRRMAPMGDHLLRANGRTGLRITDISAPTEPEDIGVYATQVAAHAIRRQGDYLYVASAEKGVKIVDISEPTVPFEAAFYDTLGEARDLAVNGNTAYVADGSRGLLTLDITDPLMPRGLDAIFDITDARGVEVDGNLAYVAAHLQGLRVADVTNPLLIFEIGSYTAGNAAQDLTLEDDLVYLADGAGGLRTLDVSVPETPQEIGHLDTPFDAREVTVDGRRAFLTESTQATVIDINDPTQPTLLGQFDDCNPADLVVNGDLGYLACRSDLRVLDLSDTNSIGVIETRLNFNTLGASVTLDGSLLFLGYTTDGVEIFDVSACQNLLRDGFESGDVSAWSGSMP